MAATGKVTISGSVTGGPGGAKTIGPASVESNSAVDDRDTKTLAAGDNTITVPTGATGVVIVPPDNNLTPISLGAGGAFDIAPDQPSFLALPTGTTTFVVNASDALSSVTMFDFF